MDVRLCFARFAERIERENLCDSVRSRVTAFFSAAIAMADMAVLSDAIAIAKSRGVKREALNEAMLQSFLILGFPRMIEAAKILSEKWPDGASIPSVDRIKAKSKEVRVDDGFALCRQVYGENYESLRKRIAEMSPDVFELMITEGYGKIYLRPGLSVIDRELSNVSSLIVDNRPLQLHSHIRGAINVGAGIDLLGMVIEDVGPEVGQGYQEAIKIMNMLTEI